MSAVDKFIAKQYQYKIPPAVREATSGDMKPWGKEACKQRIQRLLAEAHVSSEVDKFWADTIRWVQGCSERGYTSIAESCLQVMSDAWDEMGADDIFDRRFGVVKQEDEWF